MRNSLVVIVLAFLPACDSPGESAGQVDGSVQRCRDAWQLVCDNDVECNTTAPGHTLCENGAIDIEAICAKPLVKTMDWDACEQVVDNSICPRVEDEPINDYFAAAIDKCSPR